MKLALVTPFSVHSAIGRYAGAVGDALRAAGADVVIYRTDDPKREQARSYDGPVRPWRALLKARGEHDAVVYNIGNHYPYHHPVVSLMPQVPGIGVFHDFYLYSLFHDWLVAESGLHAHDSIVSEIYGPAALDDRAGATASHAAIAERRPMTEWLARHATAAVAHSTFYAERLRRSCAGPVRVVPLAWPGPAEDPEPGGGEDGGVVVVTAGHMNPNKRAASVIEAIGADPKLRSACEYRCVGPIEGQERERLTDLAARLGVRLRLTGRVSDEEMARHLRDADIVTCLRWPTFEGGSASLAEAMMSACPVVVTDAGCYLDVPDDVVAKIAPEREKADLIRQLSMLAFDRPLRERLGRRGREHALIAHSPARYAEALSALAQETIELEPVTLLSRRVGILLSGMGARRGDPAVERLGRVARGLFPSSVSPPEDLEAVPAKRAPRRGRRS